MVLFVIGGLALAKARRLVQIFPSSWMMLWDSWEIRMVILYSLLIQIVLMVMGNRRKYMTQAGARAIIWAAYLSADWAATFALGLLSDSNGPKNVMAAFWAPFFLLHLAGPDTITAYSLEDNELWLRHFLSVSAQVVIAVYVSLKFWRGTLLDYASIPIFVAGLTKCVERTLALRSASESSFTESLLQSLDRRVILDFRMTIMACRAASRFISGVSSAASRFVSGESSANMISFRNEEGSSVELKRDIDDSDFGILQYAWERFMIFRRLFANLVIYNKELESNHDYLRETTSDKAFMLIEIELGLAYDLWYTKAKLTYSRVGCLLRFISSSSSIMTFVVFLVVDKHQYSKVDLTITWLLLVGAIFLEFYATTILLSSDWFMIWLVDPTPKWVLRNLKAQLKKPIGMVVPFLQFLHVIPVNKRWSATMGQYNFISFCCYKKPKKSIRILKFFGIYAVPEKERLEHVVKIPKELKEWIFHRLQEKMDRDTRKTLSFHIKDVMKEFNCLEFFINSNLENMIGNIETQQSILIWHIATDLCYNHDHRESRPKISASDDEILRGSKWLSEYMLYLFITKPSMLPKGIGKLCFRDTCSEVRREIPKCSVTEALTQLYRFKSRSPDSCSVLGEAGNLARCLQSLGLETGWDTKRKWRLISHIWIEMICYTATECSPNEHLQQLRRGGELLTHVWFLMAHMGFNDLVR